MSFELAALVAAAIVLAWAQLRAGEVRLLFAVAAYTSALILIVQRDLSLLFPALGVAIALGLLGVTRGVIAALKSDGVTLDVTGCHNTCEVDTNNTGSAEFIGSSPY